MSAPLTAPAGTDAVPGERPRPERDGAPAGPGGTRRPLWRRHWFPVLAVALLLGSTVLLVVARGTTSALPLAPDNPEPGGAMAAAQVLQAQGVDVRLVRTTDAAVRMAAAGTTLLVTGTNVLDEDQLAALRGTEADLVLTQTAFAALGALTDAVEPDPAGSREPVPARCTDPHARAAGTISRSTGGVRALREDVEVCFPTGSGTGAYAAWQQDGRTLRVLADPQLLSNTELDQAGNAALVLRILGQHRELVWYLPTPGDTVGADGGTGADLLPPEAEVLGLQLLVLGLVVVAWRGRRLGRVVTEPLPVVVRAAETTRGRGRLYRRSGAYAHAGAALRAGCAHRLARRLGLPRSAAATELLEATARATGRGEDELTTLLYGPPPADDAGLLSLTRALDTLESEVHRT